MSEPDDAGEETNLPKLSNTQWKDLMELLQDARTYHEQKAVENALAAIDLNPNRPRSTKSYMSTARDHSAKQKKAEILLRYLGAPYHGRD